MAGSGHHTALRSSNQSFTAKLLLLLTILPLTLAAFAFVLQWRGGVTDPSARYSADNYQFPGMESSAPATTATSTFHVSRSDCGALLTHSSPSFPYFRDWKFNYQPDLKPKAFIIASAVTEEEMKKWVFNEYKWINLAKGRWSSSKRHEEGLKHDF